MIYEKLHPFLVTCFKRQDGSISLFVFIGANRWIFDRITKP